MDTGKKKTRREHAYCPALWRDPGGNLRECGEETGELRYVFGGKVTVDYNQNAATPRDGFRCKKHGRAEILADGRVVGGFDCSH